MPALDSHGSMEETTIVEETTYWQYFTNYFLSSPKQSSRSQQEQDINYCKENPNHSTCLGQEFHTSSSVMEKSVTKIYPTDEVIFLFISDVGGDAIVNYLVKAGDSSKISEDAMKQMVKTSIDNQWEKLQFAKTISDIVPFQPLDRKRAADFMKAEIKRFSKRFTHQKWLNLVVDDEIVDLLTSPLFLKYVRYSFKTPTRQPSSSSSSSSTTEDGKVVSGEFVKFGGRDVNGISMRKLMGVVLKYSAPRPGRDSYAIYVMLHLVILIGGSIDCECY